MGHHGMQYCSSETGYCWGWKSSVDGEAAVNETIEESAEDGADAVDGTEEQKAEEAVETQGKVRHEAAPLKAFEALNEALEAVACAPTVNVVKWPIWSDKIFRWQYFEAHLSLWSIYIV